MKLGRFCGFVLELLALELPVDQSAAFLVNLLCLESMRVLSRLNIIYCTWVEYVP
jgi:hypothetical protein